MSETLSEKFVAGPLAIVATQCVFCKHLNDYPPGGCPAFPGGIPEPITLNQADHREPYAGDGGIRFEARADVPPAVLANLWKHVPAPVA